jgi:hypothetical protein
VAETMTKADAEKKFRKLTANLHNARARNDYIAVRAIDEERQLLSDALHPGDNRPKEGRVL